MLIIGVDYHPSDQQIAFTDTETGECGERRLHHSDQEAEKFYRDLKQKGVRVRVGMEATGYARWFERLLAELGIELWIGDAAEIKTKRVRKQKTDRQDAQLLLKLLLEDRFPRVWVPDPENRDLRQLLWHRHRLVQMRTRIMNQLQAVAMNEGKRWKKRLWSEQGRAQLEKFVLAPWASRRRQDLSELWLRSFELRAKSLNIGVSGGQLLFNGCDFGIRPGSVCSDKSVAALQNNEDKNSQSANCPRPPRPMRKQQQDPPLRMVSFGKKFIPKECPSRQDCEYSADYPYKRTPQNFSPNRGSFDFSLRHNGTSAQVLPVPLLCINLCMRCVASRFI